MITRKFKISGLSEVRLFVNQNLDQFIIIVEEKIGSEWHPMIRKDHTITDIDAFNLDEYIIEAMEEYAKKKKVEEHVTEILSKYENNDEIEFN